MAGVDSEEANMLVLTMLMGYGGISVYMFKCYLPTLSTDYFHVGVNIYIQDYSRS